MSKHLPQQDEYVPSLKWITTGLIALFILGGVVFYSVSVDIRDIGGTQAPTIGVRRTAE
jgi:hypothetical protein